MDLFAEELKLIDAPSSRVDRAGGVVGGDVLGLGRSWRGSVGGCAQRRGAGGEPDRGVVVRGVGVGDRVVALRRHQHRLQRLAGGIGPRPGDLCRDGRGEAGRVQLGQPAGRHRQLSEALVFRDGAAHLDVVADRDLADRGGGEDEDRVGGVVGVGTAAGLLDGVAAVAAGGIGGGDEAGRGDRLPDQRAGVPAALNLVDRGGRLAGIARIGVGIRLTRAVGGCEVAGRTEVGGVVVGVDAVGAGEGRGHRTGGILDMPLEGVGLGIAEQVDDLVVVADHRTSGGGERGGRAGQDQSAAVAVTRPRGGDGGVRRDGGRPVGAVVGVGGALDQVVALRRNRSAERGGDGGAGATVRAVLQRPAVQGNRGRGGVVQLDVLVLVGGAGTAAIDVGLVDHDLRVGGEREWGGEGACGEGQGENRGEQWLLHVCSWGWI